MTQARATDERRTRILKVRLSPAERHALAERATECGKPSSTYVREAALGSVPRARRSRLEQKAVYHLGRIGNNLNQLARAAHTAGEFRASKRLDAVLEELLNAIRRLT